MPGDRVTILGEHPSGALICQTCGASAALVATFGPDWSGRRRRSKLQCNECARVALTVAERFGLTLAIERADGRSLRALPDA